VDSLKWNLKNVSAGAVASIPVVPTAEVEVGDHLHPGVKDQPGQHERPCLTKQNKKVYMLCGPETLDFKIYPKEIKVM
jgi:hypothetical protein